MFVERKRWKRRRSGKEGKGEKKGGEGMLPKKKRASSHILFVCFFPFACFAYPF